MEVRDSSLPGRSVPGGRNRAPSCHKKPFAIGHARQFIESASGLAVPIQSIGRNECGTGFADGYEHAVAVGDAQEVEIGEGSLLTPNYSIVRGEHCSPVADRNKCVRPIDYGMEPTHG